jgi:ribonuclease HI
MCIRDDEGWYLLARTLWITPPCTTEVGEALGLLHTIQWVHDLRFDNVDFTLDSKKVVDNFH